ncbi:MAG: hypothetical protein LBG05_08200 [Treponema sp.]|jgi:uncharacterized membrane protein YoaK (UPF0700 family)|nr:hypothetical protein [Treponema sp.]
MNIYKPLRITLFSYEILRFIAFAIHGGVIFTTIQEWQWIAPNALFPLAALFLLIDFNRYAVFLPLSISGKSIAAILTVWSVMSSLMEVSAKAPFFDASIAMGDIFSILAYIYVMKGVKKQVEENEGGEE